MEFQKPDKKQPMQRSTAEKPFFQHAWWILALLFLALLGAGTYAYYLRETAEIHTDRAHDLAAIAALKIGELTAWREERYSDAEVISQNQLLRDAVTAWLEERSDLTRLEAVSQYFQTIQNAYGYESVFLVSPEGELLISSQPRPEPLEPQVLSLTGQAIQDRRPVFGDFFLCPTCKQIHLDVAAPIFAPDRSAVGVLFLRTDPEVYLYPFIQSWPTPSQSAETLLVRMEDGEVLFLNRLRHNSDPPLTFHIPLTQEDVPAVKAVQGQTGLVEGPDYRGVPVLAYIEPVPNSPWFLIAKVDRQELLAEAVYRGRVTVFFAGLGAALILAAAALLFSLRQRWTFQQLYESERQRADLQEQFRTTLYSIGDAVIASDRSGRVRLMNPVAELLTGWSEAEAYDRPLEEIFNIINEETRQPVENPVQRVLREGKVFGLANHTLLIDRAGNERPIADSGAPLFSEADQIEGVVLVFRDQTEERRAHKALVESESRYRSLFEYSAIGISLTAPDGRMMDANPAFAEMLGYRIEEIRQFSFEQINHPDDIPKTKELRRRLLEGESDRERLVKRYRHKSGADVWVDISSSIVRDETGQPLYFITSILNITAQKQAEDALAKSEAELRALYESMTELVVQHELVLDEQGQAKDYRILDCNPVFSRITGIPREQAVGRLASQVYHTDPAPFLEIYARVAQTGEPIQFETEFAPMGKFFQISAICPEPGRFATVASDITLRKQAEKDRQESEERFRKAINEAPFPIMLHAEDGQVLQVNNTWCETTGYSRAELSTVGDWTRLAYGEQSDRVRQVINRTYTITERINEGDFEIRTRRGEPRIWQFSSAPLGLLPDGRRLVISIAADMTEQRKAEAEIQELNRTLEQQVAQRTAELSDLYNNAPCGYHSLDAEGVYVRVNDTELHWLGYTREELLDKVKFPDLLTPASKPAFYHHFPIFKESGQVNDLEFEMVCKDGSILPVLLSATAIRDPDGNYMMSRSTIIDHTERKRIERALQESHDRLQAANQELEAFAYSVSHDLRAPLRAMDGFSSALLSSSAEKLDEQSRHYLARVREASQKMGHLINDLLDLSRITRRELEMRTVNLSQLAHEIAQELQAQEPDRRVQFVIEEDLTVRGDEALLRILLQNLIGNAWKFSQPRPEAVIEIGCRSEGGRMVCFVRDNGVGFNMSYADKLFVPFQRLHGAHEFPGTGIGLATVQRIVRRHGGRIWAESVEGQGATFAFTLEESDEQENPVIGGR